MTLLVKLLLVAGGGAVGSVVRYIFESHFHTAIVTAVINILGSFLMGLFAGWVAAGVMGADRKALVSALLMSGFCGGFSTFAHFAIITVNYFRQDAMLTTFGYILITVVSGLLCAFAGYWIGTRWLA